MKKFLFLALLLVGCDSPNAVEYSAEQLVKYECKPTGETLINKVLISTHSTETRDDKYYIYKCNGDKPHMSKVLIEKNNV